MELLVASEFLRMMNHVLAAGYWLRAISGGCFNTAPVSRTGSALWVQVSVCGQFDDAAGLCTVPGEQGF